MENRKMNNRALALFLAGMFSLVFTGYFASAFAVVASSLQLYPGQNYDAAFAVMNTIPGSSALTVQASLVEGSDIASFTGSNRVNVPAEGVLSVPVRYRIPSNAAIGTVYTVTASFSSVSGGTGSGSVNFGQDVAKSISITVVEKPKMSEAPVIESAEMNIWWWVLIIVVIVILIVWWLLRRKR